MNPYPLGGRGLVNGGNAMKIKVTDRATEEILSSVGERTTDVRILVKGYGWGGPVFGIALDEQTENDYAMKIGDQNFVVENELIDVYQGFEIDFQDNWFSKGFTVRATYGGSSC